MPSQPIAFRAGRKAIGKGQTSSFPSLDDVICFPITGKSTIPPTPLLKVNGIAAKVTMPLRLFPYPFQKTFSIHDILTLSANFNQRLRNAALFERLRDAVRGETLDYF